MNKSLITLCGFILIGAMVVTGVHSSKASPVETDPVHIQIQVSPQTLVLGLQGEWVTVHADIPLRTVASTSIKLNGITASSVFADDRGDLVAKFHQSEIENIVAPPQAVLTLTGNLITGEALSGSDTIAVKKNGKK